MDRSRTHWRLTARLWSAGVGSASDASGTDVRRRRLRRDVGPSASEARPI